MNDVIINKEFMDFVREIEIDRTIMVTDGFIHVPFSEELEDIVEEFIRSSASKESED